MDKIAGDNSVDWDLMEQLLITWTAFVKFSKKMRIQQRMRFCVFSPSSACTWK